MSGTLLKGLAGSTLAVALFSVSLIRFRRVKSRGSLMQLIGAGGLAVMAGTHLCEAFRIFPSMGWGLEGSAGHYLDLSGAVLGLTLFPLGFALSKRGR